ASAACSSGGSASSSADRKMGRKAIRRRGSGMVGPRGNRLPSVRSAACGRLPGARQPLHASQPRRYDAAMARLPSLLVLVALLLALPAARATEPVAAVRVSFDRDGITATEVHGLADKAQGRRVNAGDPVRIASISKLVTTIAVMRLVEAGKLDLDADAGDLLGFPLRNPAFPDQPITLRMLLSHRSKIGRASCRESG